MLFSSGPSDRQFRGFRAWDRGTRGCRNDRGLAHISFRSVPVRPLARPCRAPPPFVTPAKAGVHPWLRIAATGGEQGEPLAAAAKTKASTDGGMQSDVWSRYAVGPCEGGPSASDWSDATGRRFEGRMGICGARGRRRTGRAALPGPEAGLQGLCGGEEDRTRLSTQGEGNRRRVHGRQCVGVDRRETGSRFPGGIAASSSQEVRHSRVGQAPCLGKPRPVVPGRIASPDFRSRICAGRRVRRSSRVCRSRTSIKACKARFSRYRTGIRVRKALDQVEIPFGRPQDLAQIDFARRPCELKAAVFPSNGRNETSPAQIVDQFHQVVFRNAVGGGDFPDGAAPVAVEAEIDESPQGIVAVSRQLHRDRLTGFGVGSVR